MPHGPAVPLLGTYTEKTISQKDADAPAFMAALSPTARTWEQPERPSAEGWVKRRWYIHAVECYADGWI